MHADPLERLYRPGGQGRRHPAARLDREAYETACLRLGIAARDDGALEPADERLGTLDPHALRLRGVRAEAEERRWRMRSGFEEDAGEPEIHALPAAAMLRTPYTGLRRGARWEGGQAGRWEGGRHVSVSLPGHPRGWFVEDDGPVPLEVSVTGASPHDLRGTDSTGLARDMSQVSRVWVLIDPDAGTFRVLTRLRVDDYIDGPLGDGGDGDPAIELIAHAGGEVEHPAVPGEGAEALLARAVQAGRDAVFQARELQALMLANHARYATFVESLPGTLDGPSYAASVRALGFTPHLDHEIAGEARHWPALWRSCGHADILHDALELRVACARLLDEVRSRTVSAILDPAPAAPAP